MSFNDEDDEKVGYCRPPVKTRFEKGKSGNPAGRPKSRPDVITAIDRELNQRISTIENGKSRTMTKAEIIAKQTVNKAVRGDQAATKMLMNYGLQRMRRADLQAMMEKQDDMCNCQPTFQVLSPEENEVRLQELLRKGGYQRIPPSTVQNEDPEQGPNEDS